MNIIDRRLNPKGKSLPNRQRLLRRLKAQVRKAVSQSIAGRRVAEIDSMGRKRRVVLIERYQHLPAER